MTDPLTAEEIAELRQWQAGADLDGRAESQIRRALDEVEYGREIRRIISVCPTAHPAEHAAWCGGCCAKFDPGRMVLVHGADCKFRGHERAER